MLDLEEIQIPIAQIYKWSIFWMILYVLCQRCIYLIRIYKNERNGSNKEYETPKSHEAIQHAESPQERNDVQREDGGGSC